MKEVILGLDLSTTASGYCLLDLKGNLLEYGVLKPSGKGLSKLIYPLKQLMKMIDLSKQIDEIYDYYSKTYDIKTIVIEEIAGSRQRMGQKTLDGLHWILMHKFYSSGYINKVSYYDVTGAKGWRHHLGLKLDAQDKLHNKEARKLNKKLSGKNKLPVYNAKHLAQRFVNETHDTEFDVEINKTDNDICDAIAMTTSFVRRLK